MSVVSRGAKNAFRNLIRTFSITLILAISIALALIMLLAMRAVQSRITSVKSSIGNTITVSPAGGRGFAGGGEPLVASDVAIIKGTANVTKVSASLVDRLTTTGATTNANFGGGDNSGGTTNLVSSIDAGTLGRRFNRASQPPSANGEPSAAPTFTLPVSITGTTDPTSTQVAGSSQFKLTSGTSIDGNSSKNVALIGTALAAKNNLKVGGTFTAYDQTITVAGIYDAGNTFADAGVIMPLATVQTLSAQPGDVTSVNVQVDSITDVSGVVSALESKLGSKADVVSAQDSSNQALAPLENIQTISLYSLIGALAAGSIIIFLTMLMIVRERRREIGVLKAIGSSNAKITLQFVVESLTLTLMGAVVGVVAGVLLSNPVLKILVSSNQLAPVGGMVGGGFGGRGLVRAFGRVGGAISNVHAVVGYDILIYGLLAALLIAVLGSAIPAWLISKVRPAEVMRAE